MNRYVIVLSLTFGGCIGRGGGGTAADAGAQPGNAICRDVCDNLQACEGQGSCLAECEADPPVGGCAACLVTTRVCGTDCVQFCADAPTPDAGPEPDASTGSDAEPSADAAPGPDAAPSADAAPAPECGNGVVEPGEACDGEPDCDPQCRPLPLVEVVVVGPADGATDVPLSAQVQVRFSDAIDPATVRADTLRVAAVGWVDGAQRQETDGLAGRWHVEGETATFIPERGYLAGFETEHVVTATDRIRDLMGRPIAAPGAVARFRTGLVDPAHVYRIRNVQLPGPLDTSANTYLAHLSPIAGNTSGSFWWFTPRDGEPYLLMRNLYGGEDLYFEGSDGSQPALLSEGGDFSGQQWLLASAEPRQGPVGPRESASSYYLQTEFQGPNRGLGGLGTDANGVRLIGMKDLGQPDLRWYLENAGPRLQGDAEVVGLAYFPGNGHYYARVGAQTVTWADARDAAAGLRLGDRVGHLATITSQEEHDFVAQAVGLDDIWLGAYQEGDDEPAGGWRWVTGEPWDYTNWAPGEPSDSDPGEQWLSTFAGGDWNDNVEVWDYLPGNRGYVVELPPAR